MEVTKQMGFVKFMVSPAGRITRIVAGIALILVGILLVQGTVGIIVGVVGLVPLLAGLVDVCVFAPLFGMPFTGEQARNL
jgi:Inner membrane protein YgaP-like, transmembrane domain